MTQSLDPISTAPSVDDLKAQIKRLNSKAGQLKMDLHDLAEGLPNDYEHLMDLASQTYAVYRLLNTLKQQLSQLERAR